MTPAPDTDRTDRQADGLREEIARCLCRYHGEDPDEITGLSLAPPHPRRWAAYGAMADALLAGPLAQLRSDLRATEAERDQLREEWAQEGIGWLRDRDIERLMSAEANLIALAKMYGEACTELHKLWLALDWDDVAWGMYTFRRMRERAEAAEAERDLFRTRVGELEKELTLLQS